MVKVKSERKQTPLPDPSRELARVIVQASEDLKGLDPLLLDVRGLTSFTDYIFIASGTSDRHVQAIGRRIDADVHQAFKKNPLGVEGAEAGVWILLDYGDVICHVFLDEKREFYRLEDLWHEAKKVRFKKEKVKKSQRGK